MITLKFMIHKKFLVDEIDILSPIWCLNMLFGDKEITTLLFRMLYHLH